MALRGQLVDARQLVRHVELRECVGRDAQSDLVEWDGPVVEIDELGESLGVIGLSVVHRITLSASQGVTGR